MSWNMSLDVSFFSSHILNPVPKLWLSCFQLSIADVAGSQNSMLGGPPSLLIECPWSSPTIGHGTFQPLDLDETQGVLYFLEVASARLQEVVLHLTKLRSQASKYQDI